MKARVLELMTFMLEPRDYNDKFLQRRASRGAQSIVLGICIISMI
jgi:hypothetical protein